MSPLSLQETRRCTAVFPLPRVVVESDFFRLTFPDVREIVEEGHIELWLDAVCRPPRLTLYTDSAVGLQTVLDPVLEYVRVLKEMCITEEEDMRAIQASLCADGLVRLNCLVHALVWASDEKMFVHTTLNFSEISNLDSMFQFADTELSNVPFV